MPVVETEWEELQRLIKEPLPGGRGFQAAKAKRMEDLRAIVVRDMFEQMNVCGTEAFKSLWDDYHPEGDD
jgi:hypothetical protein